MHEVFRLVGGLLNAVLFHLTARAITLLPVRLLTRLGAWIAETRPLGRYAGWRFAIEESNATVPVRIRRLLWDYFKEKGFQHPVRVKWFHSLKLDLVLGNDQSRCLYVGGSFEPNEFALLADVLRPGMVVVDAGANEGFYSVFMATRVGGDGQVIAVEPSPRERARLERNVTINNLRNVHVEIGRAH